MDEYETKLTDWAKGCAHAARTQLRYRKEQLEWIVPISVDTPKSITSSIGKGQYFCLGCDDNPSYMCLESAINNFLVAHFLNLKPTLYLAYDTKTEERDTLYNHSFITIRRKGKEYVKDATIDSGFLIRKEGKILIVSGIDKEDLENQYNVREEIDLSECRVLSSLDSVLSLVREMRSVAGAVRILERGVFQLAPTVSEGVAKACVVYNDDASSLDMHLDINLPYFQNRRISRRIKVDEYGITTDDIIEMSFFQDADHFIAPKDPIYFLEFPASLLKSLKSTLNINPNAFRKRKNKRRSRIDIREVVDSIYRDGTAHVSGAKPAPSAILRIQEELVAIVDRAAEDLQSNPRLCNSMILRGAYNSDRETKRQQLLVALSDFRRIGERTVQGLYSIADRVTSEPVPEGEPPIISQEMRTDFASMASIMNVIFEEETRLGRRAKKMKLPEKVDSAMQRLREKPDTARLYTRYEYWKLIESEISALGGLIEDVYLLFVPNLLFSFNYLFRDNSSRKEYADWFISNYLGAEKYKDLGAPLDSQKLDKLMDAVLIQQHKASNLAKVYYDFNKNHRETFRDIMELKCYIKQKSELAEARGLKLIDFLISESGTSAGELARAGVFHNLKANLKIALENCDFFLNQQALSEMLGKIRAYKTAEMVG